MAFSNEFSHTIVLPMVDMIHEAIVAFLQTSEHGAWDLDGTRPNNSFRLHFIRGNWGSSFFGSNRVPKNCNFDNRGEFVPRTKPMLLEIATRPSPQEISITIRHSVFSKQEVPRRDYADYCDYWLHRSRQEVNSLRQYLKKCYNLGDMPRLDTTNAT